MSAVTAPPVPVTHRDRRRAITWACLNWPP